MRENALRLRSLSDVVTAIPYLIGFHPDDSLVVLGYGGPEGTYAVRLDLTAEDDLVEHVAEVVARRTSPEVILVGYGPGERVTPMVEKMSDRLAAWRAGVRDAVRVHEGRFWSYMCSDPGCCPPEGVVVDAADVVAAQATAGGLVALADRRELESTIEPAGGAELRAATARAEVRLAALTTGDGDEARRRMAEEGLPLVRSLIERACANGDPPTDDEVAWLGVLLTSLRVRDEAWVRMEEADLASHVGLWRDVVRRVGEAYVAAPASLLAFASWRSGDGALANIALDRALTADPGYTMARLLRDLFASGLPPWSVPLAMTPDQLEEF